jgi:CheY-like chemotaxis protein
MQLKNKNTKSSPPVILFADDDKICLDVSVKILQKLGYKVLEARDGKEAIDVYNDNQDKIDLVILDMKMPYNGGQTFDRLKKINADLKIILTSGYTEDYGIHDLINKGCAGFHWEIPSNCESASIIDDLIGRAD